MPIVGPILRKIKRKASELQKDRLYGQYWNEEIDADWYQKIFDSKPLMHQAFIEFLKSKNDIKSALEIGCGSGIYPIKYKELFAEYTGIDIGAPAIEYCKKHSDFTFIQGDFINMDLGKEYDLVFSHSVIDHVYDIKTFLLNMVKHSSKYVYISSYRGYFPELEKHQMEWNENENCYFNNLSVKELKQTLAGHNFTIKKQETGDSEMSFATVIQVLKDE